MAKRVAGGKRLPGEVMQQIIEKTDGVPLFVEEMTKAVLESSALQEVDGRYEPTGSLSTLTIPASLQDSLMARLDRLVTAKAVAQYAAVIGRQFSYELLHAVSDVDGASLQRELGRLVEAELVYQRGVVPGATYLFKHALVQDIAYQSLLRSTRQHYHQRIANVLEAQFADIVQTQPELLAHHYTAAGCSEQAVTYWQRSGERAVARSANAEAIDQFSKGLEILKTLPSTAERIQQELTLHIALGAPLMVVKGYGAPEVENAYARARELCQQVGDTPQLFSALWGLARFYTLRADLKTVQELGNQLLTLAERLQNPARLLEAHSTLGAALYWMGELNTSRSHLEQSLRLYDPDEHRALALRAGHDHAVACLTYLARALWFLGYPDQALARADEALKQAQELSHPFTLGRALTMAGMVQQYLRDMLQVQERADAVIDLANQHGFTLWLADGTMLRGWTLAAQGRPHEGLLQLRQGITAARAAGAEVGYTNGLTMLADACRKAGQAADGLEVINEVLVVVSQKGVRVFEAELYRLKGELLLSESLNNTTEAEPCFHQALDIARRQQAKSWELRAATSLARLWQSQGKRPEAYDLLQPVYGWFTEGFDTADLKEAKALLEEIG
jgi:predicted ATPase